MLLTATSHYCESTECKPVGLAAVTPLPSLPHSLSSSSQPATECTRCHAVVCHQRRF